MPQKVWIDQRPPPPPLWTMSVKKQICFPDGFPYTHMQSSHGREQHIFGPLRLSRPPAYKWVRESILRKSCFLSDIALGGGRPGNSLGTTVTLLGTPFGFSRECITGAIAGYIYRISYGDIQMWIFFPFHMHKKSRKS